MSETKIPSSHLRTTEQDEEDHETSLPARHLNSSHSHRSQLPPPPIMMHSATPAVPNLQSAPPSGNLSSLPPPPTILVDLPPPPPPPQVGEQIIPMDLPPPPTMSAVTDSIPPPPPPPVPAFQELPPLRLDEGDELAQLEEPAALPLTTFAPKSHSFLAKRQTHLPILVIATEAANRLAWKNKLRLTDMLEGLTQDLSSVGSGYPLAPFRSLGRSILMKWDDIKLTFCEPRDMVQNDASHELLQSHAALKESDGNLREELDLLEEQVDQLLADSKTDEHLSLMDHNRQRQTQLKQVVRDAYALTSPPNIPWLWRFRLALDDSTNYLSHDLIQQPAICLLVCSSHDEDDLDNCFSDLANPYNLPHSFYGSGLWDSDALKKEAIVLHDTVEGPKDVDLDLMEIGLKQKYGPNAAVLRVNSIVPSMAKALEEEETTDIWDGKGKRGNCLSVSDRLVLRRYIAKLVTSSLLPAMERRIADLNNIVTERKKGVRNVFRGLFRPNRSTTGKEYEEKDVGDPGHYRHDSVESQVRLLADSLFLMKDYEPALSMYKLIKDDYKSDHAMIHYASVQEMMALSSYLLDPQGREREVFQYVETALFSYTRAAEDERGEDAASSRPTNAPIPTRLATRLCLVLSSVKTKTEERHLEIADLLASASSHETSLGAAVLLEQSSAHYYKASMYRKYAFHMLMSGHMFRSAFQEHHAFRCFTSALYVYHDGQWDELHNHLRSALAAQLYSLGRMAISVELYSKLVGTKGGGRVSVKSQQKFVNHLLEICKDHTKKALVGADRMAAHPSGSLRRERFERIEQVIGRTKGSTRVLEIPNMDLPSLDDSSISVQVEAEARVCNKVIPSLGKTSKGDETVWEELQCHAIAELRAHGPTSSRPNDEVALSVLAKIVDPDVRSVIAEIHREKTNMNVQARSKRSGSYKPQPATRARMEPILVQFEMKNPLSIRIEMKEIQLVARLKEKDTDRMCTNEDAIAMGPMPAKTWTFQGSQNTFLTPEFCRMSTLDSLSWTSATTEVPFFVVTKSSASLEPGGSSTIALCICPLAKGDLEILGARCRLFDSVWVFHPFNVKGPLLQNTQENRAGRKRAEPILLKSRVEDDMPRLAIELVPSQLDDSGPAIQGQISSWTLRVSNIGTASASNLSLKTNVPWVNVYTSGRQGDNPEEEATSRCVGPSGTLLSLPLAGPGLEIEGIIQPSESVDIPIAIRTLSENSQQDFYMLFRYELPSGGHRWLRQMITVPIHPSLAVSASLMPSYWAKNEHIVSVEISNYRSHEVFLEDLTVASREYRLQPIQGQISEPTSLCLDVRERATLHYRLIPTTGASSTCVLTKCKLSSDAGSSRQECVTSDAVDYLCLELAESRFKTALNKYQHDLRRATAAEEQDHHPRHVSHIRRAKSFVSERSSMDEDDGDAHPTSILRLFPKNHSKTLIDFICTWRTSDSSGHDYHMVGFHGQHHVVGLPVRPRVKSTGCPITITCSQHPSNVTHDFGTGPAHVHFEVTVRNRLVESDVEFEFSVERPHVFEFVGADSFSWRLRGGEELRIPLQAVIFSAGVYNLQKVRLTVMKEDKHVPYLFPLQWMVTVRDLEKASE